MGLLGNEDEEKRRLKNTPKYIGVDPLGTLPFI